MKICYFLNIPSIIHKTNGFTLDLSLMSVRIRYTQFSSIRYINSKVYTFLILRINCRFLQIVII